MANQDANIDSVAIKIQKALSNIPVVILGTGATIPYGLPSMQVLADHLIASISDSSQSWGKFVSLLRQGTDLETAMQTVDLGSDLTVKIVKETWKSVNEKDVLFYRQICSDINYNFPIRLLFSKLIKTCTEHFDVITTNYDRLAEYAADLAQINSRTGYLGQYIQWNRNNILKQKPVIDIWKVHGSLDWVKIKDRLFSLPMYNGSITDAVPQIVTPGLSKYRETHLEPYRTVITNADNAIQQSQCILCIGYGFNDEHIQPKLLEKVTSGKPIVVITKKLSDNGSRLLIQNNVDSIILQDSGGGKTNVNYQENGTRKNVTLNGSYWELNELLKIW